MLDPPDMKTITCEKYRVLDIELDQKQNTFIEDAVLEQSETVEDNLIQIFSRFLYIWHLVHTPVFPDTAADGYPLLPEKVFPRLYKILPPCYMHTVLDRFLNPAFF